MRLNLLNHCRIFGLVAIIYIYIYISIARSQRIYANGSQFNHNITTKDKNPKPNPSSYPNNIPLKSKDKFLDLPSFVAVTNDITKPTVDTSSTNANIRALVLDDQNLIDVEDPSMVLLVNLEDVNSMSNMYVISRNEGFTELKIHHVVILWIWIQFPSSSSTNNFQTNASLKSFFSCIKTAKPSFKVDEHVNGMKKVEDSVDENSLADLNDLKETINELASNEIQHPISKENMDQEDDINKVSPEIAVSSDLSRPPDEVQNAVWDCGSSKALDPDGFSFAFVKKYWNDIKVNILEACLSSFRASILVNGSPTSEFYIKHGLRKGDALSSFLFILVMEWLHNALSTAGIGVLDVDVSSMASNSGCTSGSFPFTYLGLPIGSNMSLTSSWKVLLERFQ
nr:RNA-directed DNA polymerase, eukaryota [Tanacetum cinerariifolium]